MKGRLPVPASTSCSQWRARAWMVAGDCPPVTSMSSITGKSPFPSLPTLLMTRFACATSSSPGSKNWYALRMMPFDFISAQLPSKVESI